MSPLIYVDQSAIRAGRFEEVQHAIAELTDFVEANEPQLVAYSVFFDAAHTRMTVVHVHRDAASLERHIEVAGPRFAKFVGMLSLQSIDICGEPTRTALVRLREKAQLLGGAPVTVHSLHRGFVR